MAEYTVKIGFWVRAYDGFTVEATSDDEAIAKAKSRARETFERSGVPEHIEVDDRHDAVIVYVDEITETDHRVVAENLALNDDHRLMG